MRKIICFLAVLLTPIMAFAYELPAGRQIGLGGGILLSSPQAVDMLACPTGVGFNGQMLFGAGYVRQFELSDLDRVYAAGGYRYNNVIIYAGFSQLGRIDYYMEQIIRGVIGYNYNNITLAVNVSSKIIEIGSGERKTDLSAVALGFSAGINYGKYHLGIVGDNLNNPVLDENRDGDNKLLSVFGEIEGPSSFSLIGKVELEENEKAIYSIGQYFYLPGEHAIYLGIQSDPVMYGGGLDLSFAGFGITYAAKYHTALGMTHNISLTYGVGKGSSR